MKLKLLRQKVNLDKVVTGKDLDHATYNKKFRMWDYVVKHNLLNSSDDMTRARALNLLNDLTIYAYAFFKDDEDKPFKLTCYQDLIAGCKHSFKPNDPNQYLLFMSSNQIGKSALLILKAIQIATTEENKNVVIISRSLPQSQFLLSQLRLLLTNSKFGEGWREDVGETANTTQLTFERRVGDRTVVNRIICAPAGEGTLGYPVHYLFPDEADFYENAKTLFWKVLFPRVKKTKGQIILFSNPNAEIARVNSLMWELWNGDLFTRKFSFNFLDAPWNTQEEYDKDKRNSPSYIFQSTHDGQFPDEGGAFFTHSEIQDMLQKEWKNELPAADKTVYIALDLGKMRDSTVASVGTTRKAAFEDDKYKDLDVRYQKEFKLGTSYADIALWTRDTRDYYKAIGCVIVIGFDATGQKTFGDLLKKMGISATPVDFSRKESNKTLLFNDFKLMAENRKIKVVYSRQCENQLAGLEFKYTESKKLKRVEAKTESTHDDYPDSLAILIHIAVKPSVVPVTVTQVVPTHLKKQEDGKPSGQDSEKLAMEQAIKFNKQRTYGGGPWG